tara:strand:- start:50614 stop:51429 length:816 start_codon:yes stop_codon:yes gene_type:complete
VITYFLVNLQINPNFSIIEKFFIFLTSFFSNLFSAIAGGGAGLIQLPALLLFGLPYYKALASHKLATVALGIGGSIRNFRSLKKDFKIAFELLLFGIPGVLFGTSLVNYLSEDYLYFFLSVFSIFIGIYSFFKPNLGLSSKRKKLSFKLRLKFYFYVFVIGILNGSISSGTGLLVTILLVKVIGMDFLSSISLTFLTVGIFWNAAGGIALSNMGPLQLNILIILLLGSFLGGYLGAHLSNLKGNKLIKNFFTTVCLLVGIALFYKALNGFL